MFELLNAGGIFMYGTLGISIATLAIALQRILSLWFKFRLPAKAQVKQVLDLSESGSFPQALQVCGMSPHPLMRIMKSALVRADRSERDIRRAAQPEGGVPLLTLERLTFRFVQAGFVLLTGTLAAGLFFTEQLYGSGTRWKWDHKTVFSVLSWLCFAVLLAGRARLGWRGRFAVRMLYGGAGLLLLAYVGSRFVLEVVLGRSV